MFYFKLQIYFLSFSPFRLFSIKLLETVLTVRLVASLVLLLAQALTK